MKTMLLTIVFAIFISNTASGENELIYRSFFNYNGIKYESLLTTSLLQEAPLWESNSKPPPLAPEQAMKIALDYVSIKFFDEKYWGLDKISLVSRNKDKRWIYIIEITPLPARWMASVAIYPVKIIVLMNGKVIEPNPIGQNGAHLEKKEELFPWFFSPFLTGDWALD